MTTFLPPKVQKLFIAASGAYAPNVKDYVGFFHFGIQLGLPCMDGGTTYTAIEPNYDAIYPFLGDTSGSQQFNYLDPRNSNAAFRLSALNGYTASASGAAFNGTNQFLNTHYNQALNSSNNNIGFYLVESTNRGASTGDILGSENATATSLCVMSPRTTTSSFIGAIGGGLASNLTGITTTLGRWAVQRINTTTIEVYRNGSVVGMSTATTFISKTNADVYIGCRNFNGTPLLFTTLNTCFGAVQNVNITSSQQAEMDTIASNLIAALGR